MPINGRVSGVRFLINEAGEIVGYKNPITDADAEMPGASAAGADGTRLGASLMRLQQFPANAFAGYEVGPTGWLAVTISSPVPLTAARIALPLLSTTVAGAAAAAAYMQPLPSAYPANWSYQIDAGDGSGLVNIHRGGVDGGQFFFNGISAGTPIDDSPYPSASAGSTVIAARPAGSTLGTGAVASALWSDWLDLKVAPVRAADGRYYYGVAVQAPAAGTLVQGFLTNAGKLKALIEDATYSAADALKVIDCYSVANAGAFANWPINLRLSTADSGYRESVPFFALEALSGAACLNVASLGDSQLDGWEAGLAAATKSAYGAIHRACLAASTSARPVNFLNFNLPGATSLASLQSWLPGLEQIAPDAIGRGQSSVVTGVSRPDVLFIQYASANDNGASPTVATLRTGFGKAIRLAQLCRRNGITPVLCTVPPAQGRYSTAATGGDMTPEAARRSFNATLRTAALREGYLLMDTDLIVASNSTNPSTIAAPFAAADGVHFSDAGNAALASTALPIIQALL